MSLVGYTLTTDNTHLNRLVSITYITYIFLFLLPGLFFAVVRLGVAGEEMHGIALEKQITFYKLFCVYGYSFTAFLVPAVFAMFRYEILKWVLLALATFTSLWMLNKEFGVLVRSQGPDQKI